MYNMARLASRPGLRPRPDGINTYSEKALAATRSYKQANPCNGSGVEDIPFVNAHDPFP